MSYGLVTVTGDTESGQDVRVMIEDADTHISLSFNEDQDLPEVRCSHCDSDAMSREEAPEYGCEDSGDYVACPVKIDDHSECQTCDTDGEVARHNWAPLPLTWLNSAQIWSDPKRDEVTVTISAGDPRGSFAMRVYRVDDGSLRLSAPHPGDSLPHMPLHELSSGFYYVGYRPEEPEEPEMSQTRPAMPWHLRLRINLVYCITKLLRIPLEGE